MIAMLLFSVLILSANVGDTITIPVAEKTTLTAEDPCMYFKETMSNVAEVGPGEYKLQIGANCSEGIKLVYANGVRIAAISVSPAKPETLQNYAIAIEKEFRNIIMNYSLLREELNKLSQRVRELEQDNTKLKTEKTALETELKITKENYDLLQTKYAAISQDLESKKNKLSQMEIELKSLSEQSTTYRITTLFLVSIFLGSFTATVMMLRRH